MSDFEAYYKTFVLDYKDHGDIQREFHAILKAIFVAHPKLMSITSVGATPYFNDGDTCYHSANYSCHAILLPETGLDFMRPGRAYATSSIIYELDEFENMPDEDIEELDRLSDKAFEKVEQLLNMIDDTHFQRLYETNWGIIINRGKGNEPEIFHTEKYLEY